MAPSAVRTNGSHDGDSSHGRIDNDSEAESTTAAQPKPVLYGAESGEVHDLLCIGFGPASLAIAVALHDMLDEKLTNQRNYRPKVRFLEQQPEFRWHAGMLLPGTKMQISFIKDLATLRDPRSKFTFLNYLKQHDRLVQFANLDTFLPLRIEFEDYLKWAATHFANVVDYSQEVTAVTPARTGASNKFDAFEVRSRHTLTGNVNTYLARNVVVAVGGRASKPDVFSSATRHTIHSSQYNHRISEVLPDNGAAYTIGVVGAGQSAAEIFHDLHSRYPNSHTRMIIRDTALRPSDDSPFVNELFNPETVDVFYHKSGPDRIKLIQSDKATNYSVVRLGLLETIYEELYRQYITQPDKNQWPHRILTTRDVVEVAEDSHQGGLELRLKNRDASAKIQSETLKLDAVVLATGYTRNAHVGLLQRCGHINGDEQDVWTTERDYRVKLDRHLVHEDVNIWLQGCNEASHGLSDSLLSILAVRGGDLVNAMFADRS